MFRGLGSHGGLDIYVLRLNFKVPFELWTERAFESHYYNLFTST
jgi:hypothetical protein